MSELQRRALAVQPMSMDAVEELYMGQHTSSQLRLCESHERLRAELKGAEILLAEDAAVWEIMQRRKWWPYYEYRGENGWRINWCHDSVVYGQSVPWPWWEYERQTGLKATWHDPRAAIIAADKWYRENKE